MTAERQRAEIEVFAELAEICASPGYVYAIAYLCLRDNIVAYSPDGLKAEDMYHQFTPNHLIRTEICTLLGLLVKAPLDYQPPSDDALKTFVDRTDRLLEELHRSISAAAWADVDVKKIAQEKVNPLARGVALREAMFYGSESAYIFQYRDLLVEKYAQDDDWLSANKGFRAGEAREILRALQRLLDERASEAARHLASGGAPDPVAILATFSFTSAQIAARSLVNETTVERFLLAFTLPNGETNDAFRAIGDYNAVNTFPWLPHPNGSFILFQGYSLAEALYDAPFYWMVGDAFYKDEAMIHRGQFAEAFSARRLTSVFGAARVSTNVLVHERRNDRPADDPLGEIDVLVIFGDRALVVQAKSKRLTVEARRGNDGHIRDDFQKAIQDACDQGYKCAALLGDPRYILVSNGTEVETPNVIRRAYVVCLVSDHYPALSFQARQFLEYKPSAKSGPPFVADVFALDAMAEMLSTPLYFLSYVDRRSGYVDTVAASHELTVLAYHLKQNLWIGKKHQLVMLGDDVSATLDVAMLVRREGVPGNPIPEGILTRLSTTTVGKFLRTIESLPEPATIAIGFELLALSEDTVRLISDGVNALARKAIADGECHDLTVALHGAAGLTIHCSTQSGEEASAKLQGHCSLRKYILKANKWYGLCVDPRNLSIRLGIAAEFPWKQDAKMDRAAKDLIRPLLGKVAVRRAIRDAEKVGRNDRCLCGSGRKYKNCCM